MRAWPVLGSCAATSCGMGNIREPPNPVVDSMACVALSRIGGRRSQPDPVVSSMTGMAGRYRSSACGSISRFSRRLSAHEAAH